jgi:hypothetical protein
MNVVFVIDSSASMLQMFDKNFSFFDAAKNGIEEFIRSKYRIEIIKYNILFTHLFIKFSNRKRIYKKQTKTRQIFSHKHKLLR